MTRKSNVIIREIFFGQWDIEIGFYFYCGTQEGVF